MLQEVSSAATAYASRLFSRSIRTRLLPIAKGRPVDCARIRGVPSVPKASSKRKVRATGGDLAIEFRLYKGHQKATARPHQKLWWTCRQRSPAPRLPTEWYALIKPANSFPAPRSRLLPERSPAKMAMDPDVAGRTDAPSEQLTEYFAVVASIGNAIPASVRSPRSVGQFRRVAPKPDGSSRPDWHRWRLSPTAADHDRAFFRETARHGLRQWRCDRRLTNKPGIDSFPPT